MIFTIFPLLVFLATVIGYLLTKKVVVPPAIIFVVFSFISLLFFNETFFVWVITYTVLSVTITLLTKIIVDKR
ncbi:DUF2651 family protein [Metabacillus herbersteinensis]|uniref:DUF2651 family protein n=1 Tax=Metabacillus herbersteinensis TaxID=283816 RepID=A0ABV6GBJ1_9BACI